MLITNNFKKIIKIKYSIINKEKEKLRKLVNREKENKIIIDLKKRLSWKTNLNLKKSMKVIYKCNSKKSNHPQPQVVFLIYILYLNTIIDKRNK